MLYIFVEGADDKRFFQSYYKTIPKQIIDYKGMPNMSLLTATLLLKKKFTIDEVINNYYSNVDAFGYDVF
jgi:hypothetical protein